MIFTCTMNPSLDYFMSFEEMPEAGHKSRSSVERYEAGGKGVKVSLVLSNLGIPSRALGFIGGFAKDFYVSLLSGYKELIPLFTYTDGNLRINVKMTSGTSLMDVHAAGPHITDENMQDLFKKASKMDEGDYLVLAGNVQSYLEDEAVRLLETASKNHVRLVMDTNPSLMRKMVSVKPFLYKTTVEELPVILGEEAYSSRNEVIEGALKLYGMGPQNLIVLNKGKEALLVCESGVYSSVLDHEDLGLYRVGTGDGLTAGFLMNYLRSRDVLDSFKYGAGCASAISEMPDLPNRDVMDEYYEKTVVEKVR